jgi:hypothetical protein
MSTHTSITNKAGSLSQVLVQPGNYFFINPRTTPTDLQREQLIEAIGQTGEFVGIYDNVDAYDLAAIQVRSAGEYGQYACGDVITPEFFDSDKMTYTINYIILLVSERADNDNSKTRSGGREFTTNGFVVLRDLSRMENIHDACRQRNNQDGYPGSLYLEMILGLEQERFLYIEGLCANKEARPGGIDLMDIVHKCAYYASEINMKKNSSSTGKTSTETIKDTQYATYLGCKLSSLVYVIQFYFNKFSYRFRKKCGNQNLNIMDLNRDVSTLQRIPDDDSAYANSKWKSFLLKLTAAGFNSEIKLAIANRIGSLRNFIIYDADGIQTTRVINNFDIQGWADQGYKMYLCFYDNPSLGINYSRVSSFTKVILENARALAGRTPLRAAASKARKANLAAKGGRKRTKKKALKKKHRTRKRRKRRRRRRGGGLSRKKCKILRHQHARLSRSLKTIKDALQVQCKKKIKRY